MSFDLGPHLDLDACVEHLRDLIRIPSVNPPDGGPDVAAGRDPRGTPAVTDPVQVDQAFAWNPTAPGTKCIPG